MDAGRLLFAGCGLLTLLLAREIGAQTPVWSATPAEDIEYRYRVTTSENPQVCKHMGRMLNKQFRRIWRREPMPSPGPSSPYSSDGKFAFRKIEGVEHNERQTFDMSLSRLPSSPEFDAIDWRETRVTLGAPPDVQIPASDTPLAALIAYVDFDNDGRLDTLIKHGFTEGYEAIRDSGQSQEYLSVWSGATEPMKPNTSLWSLSRGARERSPVRVSGQYLRPLIHAGRTYVASYEMEFTPSAPGSAGPGAPARETMTLMEFRAARTGETICQFEMIHVE